MEQEQSKPQRDADAEHFQKLADELKEGQQQAERRRQQRSPSYEVEQADKQRHANSTQELSGSETESVASSTSRHSTRSVRPETDPHSRKLRFASQSSQEDEDSDNSVAKARRRQPTPQTDGDLQQKIRELEAQNARQAARIAQLTNFQKQMQAGFDATPARAATPPPPKPEWFFTSERHPMLNCEIWYSAEPEILPLLSLGGTAARAPCRFAVKMDGTLNGIDERFLSPHEIRRFREAGEHARAAQRPGTPASGSVQPPARRSIQPTIVDSLKQVPAMKTPVKPTTPKRRRSSSKRRRRNSQEEDRRGRHRSPRAANYSSEDDEDLPRGL